MIYLLQVSSANDSGSYLPVAIQAIVAVGLIVLLIVVTHLLGPKRKTSDKLQIFASGIESHGDARQPMAIKYFLTAILFVLFDVEVIFFYPYAVNFKVLGCVIICGILSLRLYIYNKKRRVEVGRLNQSGSSQSAVHSRHPTKD